MAITKNQSHISRSEQVILNKSMDDAFDVLAVELLGYDPTTGELKRITTQALGAFGTNNIDEASSTLTYIGKEDADGNWLIMKVDESSGITITYATQACNPETTSYSTAWTYRESLVYEPYKNAF